MDSRYARIIDLPMIIDPQGSLSFFDEENDIRRKIAIRYTTEIRNPNLVLPEIPLNHKEHVWHVYVVRCQNRNEL